MIFLNGSNVLSGSFHSAYPTFVRENNITSITLRNAEFNCLYAGRNMDDKGNLNPSFYDEYGVIHYPNPIPSDWDFCTYMYMGYSNSVVGGNIMWEISQLDGILIRRKKVVNKNIYKLLSQADYENENTWVTIDARDVNSMEDLKNFMGTDITPDTGTYTYALVPIIGNVEGLYLTTNVDTNVTRLVIADYEGVWATGITDGTCNIEHVMPSSSIETLNNSFPTIISNTSANYRTVSLSGSWYPLDNEEGCRENLTDDDDVRNAYLEAFLKWLCNRKTKIIKNVDGRRYLVYITTPPSVSFEPNAFLVHTVTFGGTEIGSINSTRDLYNCGIINIPEQYL